MEGEKETNKASIDTAGATNSGSSSVPSSQAVFGSPKAPLIERVPLLNKVPAKRRKLAYAMFGLLLVCGVGFGVWQSRDLWTNKPQEDPAYTMSDEEYATERVAVLKKTVPAASASVAEKREYYDELISEELHANNHQGVISGYEAAKKALGAEALPYNTYIAAARSYTELGDKTKALATLDAAETDVKKATSDQLLLDEFLLGISNMRKEIKG